MSSSWLKKRFNHIRRLGGFGKKSKATTDDDTLKSDRPTTTGCANHVDDKHHRTDETAARLAESSADDIAESPAISEEDTRHMVEESNENEINEDIRINAKDDQWAVEPKSSSHLTKTKRPPKFVSKLRQPLRDQSELNYFIITITSN